ncbi:RNA-binding S4 domain-containing protein [Sulfurimonas sp.]|nr:RNA-binding S4 domain-containing protein [Sulfurimonas sp.]
MKYELKDEYIELFKLLKVLDLVDSGAEAKQIISEGHVKRNSEIETKKRAKIRSGETIEVAEVTISVI